MNKETLHEIAGFPQDGYSERQAVDNCLRNYALKSHFTLSIQRSNSESIIYKCQKGGTYRNSRKIADSDRKRIKRTSRSGCPFKIRISFRKKSGKYALLGPKTPEEHSHNHALSESNLKKKYVYEKSDDSINLEKKKDDELACDINREKN